MNSRRIRFAPVKCPPNTLQFPPPTHPESRSRNNKSRSGCRECKLRRVKCDESFPVCLRCQRRGSVCQSTPRLEQWQVELPWITASRATSNPRIGMDSLTRISFINKKLLRYWFERTCHIMTLDHDTNPLSFPLLDYLSSTPSLVYTLQSISAGHEHYFKPSKLGQSLEERSKALRALREELDDYGRSPVSAFLTGYLLGMSSSYVDESVFDYGKEHLFATRQFIEDMLLKPEPQTDQWINYGLGAYIYWDMTCSMLVDPHEQRPLNTPLLYGHISQMHLNQHPITGHCTELFYLLGHLGRHCRSVVELGHRDATLEVTLEEELVQWKVPQHDFFWTITANSFRYHGLIMLYRICGRQTGNSISGIDSPHTAEAETELIISDYARSTIESLSEIPMSSLFLNMQAVPLMTAGAELDKEYTLLRQQVVARFKALYSFNRLPTNLLAIQLLEEVWEARDVGISCSWLELMLLKKWRLRLG